MVAAGVQASKSSSVQLPPILLDTSRCASFCISKTQDTVSPHSQRSLSLNSEYPHLARFFLHRETSILSLNVFHVVLGKLLGNRHSFFSQHNYSHNAKGRVPCNYFTRKVQIFIITFYCKVSLKFHNINLSIINTLLVI